MICLTDKWISVKDQSPLEDDIIIAKGCEVRMASGYQQGKSFLIDAMISKGLMKIAPNWKKYDEYKGFALCQIYRGEAITEMDQIVRFTHWKLLHRENPICIQTIEL